MAKVTIQKLTAEGESLFVEVNVDAKTLEEARQQTDPYFQLIDDRLREMNERMIASSQLMKDLPPAVQITVRKYYDFLFGRANRPEVHQIAEERRQEVEKTQKELYEKDKAARAALKKVEGGKGKGGKDGNGKGPVGHA